ncbi:MAG TPA: lysylphosphatidylglycerol synthase transmembrane domain-containing protein [Candidatus Tripitaka californicus]|uniref:lysylphosphatidylglycerol synthase transmembrane domain-containing protein n=1 Tax=Candidatus Tripitaka californicus TaxID=3367616 RepID=UPI004029358A
MRITGKSVWIVSGLLISGICLWLFLKDMEWGRVRMALGEAEYFYVLPSLLVSILVYVLRALRWQSLVSEVKRVSFTNILSATAIGFMANNILPARAGEIVRTVILGKKEGLGMATVFATIVMERLLDSMSLIILATAIFALIPSLHNAASANPTPREVQDAHFLLQLKSGVGILGATCVVILLLFIILDLYSKQAMDVIGRLLFFLPHNLRGKIISLLESFVLGLKVLKSVRQVMWLSALSFGIWFLGVAGFYVLDYSFGIQIPFTGMCLVMVCTSLAVALPQAPGYIGVFHLAVLKSLELFHVETSVAQSFAIVLWTVNLFVTLTTGSFFLWREGMSLGQMVREPASPPTEL